MVKKEKRKMLPVLFIADYDTPNSTKVGVSRTTRLDEALEKEIMSEFPHLKMSYSVNSRAIMIDEDDYAYAIQCIEELLENNTELKELYSKQYYADEEFYDSLDHLTKRPVPTYISTRFLNDKAFMDDFASKKEIEKYIKDNPDENIFE